MPDFIDQFPAIVFPEPNTGCWLCVSSNNWHGYARLKRGGRMIGAHRISYEMTCGPVPDGYEIDHLCRVSCCVNPDHLEAVTPFENKRRANAHREADRKFKCPNGHDRTPDNIYVRPSDGAKFCMKCRVICDARYRAKKKGYAS